ncbi:unnamed protein product [Vitrella brassicaformis CCMP3155]|uniref:Transcription initiation factor IIF subunit alpha n=2 Tax=Vitrella brassicaformis TaxID=1169539 RepID=A0A0G4EEN6_VITBC|nr:unnamed protein product [Vitrella brassicaformis CCMP3155]|mmetsp:Transcript_44744/g.111260  ORF Transcript_44744/g.111260 Transcript_44744/m.111260 type:complete len:431 (+) Transcript_44744:79-1371(+)|eukprot:CEL93862.1 unnamed protein product [Vitrella brassicaformis CCMP3155]
MSDGRRGTVELRLSKKANLKSFFAAKYPPDVNLRKLTEPLIMMKDVPEAKEGEESQPPKPLTQDDIQKLPWLLRDSGDPRHKEFSGSKSALDTSTYFVVVEQGNRAEAIPLSAWYDFQPKMRKTKLSVEEVERTRKTALAAAERARDRKVLHHGQEGDEEEGEQEDAAAAKRVKRRLPEDDVDADEDEDDYDVFEEEDVRKTTERHKLARMKKLKRGEGRKEADIPDSSLAMLNLEKDAVQWDWDDDGRASDDEEDKDSQAEANAKAQQEPSDDDDEDDRDEPLTNFGKDVKHLLKDVEEVAADDELAAYEGEEENEAEGPPSRDGPPAPSAEAGPPERAPGAPPGLMQPTKGPPSEYKQLKDRIIRELRRDGGRCLTKVVISRLKLKKGDAKTKLVGDILKEVATLSAPQKDGLKYLIIKPEYLRDSAE